jgi:type 1 glutamine amidotransferase
MRIITIVFLAWGLCAPWAGAQDKIKALILDGQNNHAWQQTTPVLKKLLEETGLFAVDVATAPPKGGDMTAFKPAFATYRVVISNYNGEPWSEETRTAFEKFVRGGGGFVSYHAANNAFPEWMDYNRMIAIGGWGGRNEQSGPYARFREGKLVVESKSGPGGHHGTRHPFQIVMRDTKHPISKGLPATWMHAEDELYDSLRGPAQNIRLLATAFSDPATKGTGENEPMLMTIPYEKGRVFHTTLGHDLTAMSCVGFITTLQRGTEWAATGKVSQKVPADFPTAEKVSLRRP